MNTLRTTWGTARITAVALTVLLLATCSGGVTGIFYTLATQTSRADRNLPNNVAFNVVRAGDRFYVAALSLYSTGKIGDKWSTVNHLPPSGAEVVNVLSLAYHDGHLYAGFLFDRAGKDSFGLYRAEPTGNTLRWSPVSGSGIGDKQVVRLLVAGDTLLAIVVDDSKYSLYYLSDVAEGTFTAIAFVDPDNTQLTVTVRDVAHDGTDFWVTTDDAVYRGDIQAALPEVEDGPETGAFAGVVNAQGRVYVSDRTGNVHWQEGTAWNFQAITPNDEPLTEFIYLKDRKQILVGTESLGFYSFEAGDDGSPTAVTRHPHFANKALYNAHVQRFAYLPEGDSKHLFAITFTDGLFSTTADNLDNWNQE